MQPSKTIRAICLLGVLSTLGLVLASCGGSSSADANLPGLQAMGLTDEGFAASIEGVESRVATCMSAAGFDYVPVDVQTVDLAMHAVRIEPGYSREQYKVRWGYGVTTRFDNVVKEIGLGPNLATMNGLPAVDRDAYERALYGEDPNATFAFSFDEEDFSSTGGCTRKAVGEVFTKEQVSGNYVNPKDILIDGDPRIVAAEAAWVQCMKDLGYGANNYTDQDEIIGEFQQRLKELVGPDNPATLTGPRLTQLKALQQEEIDLSLADLKCQIDHTDAAYDEVEAEILGQPLG